jgi:hypothetical protein
VFYAAHGLANYLRTETIPDDDATIEEFVAAARKPARRLDPPTRMRCAKRDRDTPAAVANSPPRNAARSSWPADRTRLTILTVAATVPLCHLMIEPDAVLRSAFSVGPG